jgi:hypothetical protein
MEASGSATDHGEKDLHVWHSDRSFCMTDVYCHHRLLRVLSHCSTCSGISICSAPAGNKQKHGPTMAFGSRTGGDGLPDNVTTK